MATNAVPLKVVHDMVETTAICEGHPVQIPRFVVEGHEPGPTLTITAAQHGRELNGIESVRRLLEWLPTQPLCGRLQVFPVVNPPAVMNVRQVVPGETQNINRIWPGDRQGTNTERIAAAVAPYITESDYLIDLHGWSNWTVDVVLTGTREPGPIMDIAKAFGLPFIFCNVEGFQPGNLKTFAKNHDVIAIGLELTPQWRLREEAVQYGFQGIQNVLIHLNMLPGSPKRPFKQWLYHTHTPHTDVIAEHAGLWVQNSIPGQPVQQNDLLGCLYSYETLKCIQKVHSPQNGILINIGPCHESIECNTIKAGNMLAQVWSAETITEYSEA